MAGTDLAIRFTENKYATRAEVAKDLKMSLIDNIWASILSYRSVFNHYLTIKTIDNTRLLFCQCTTIVSKSNAIESRLVKLLSDYSRLDVRNKEVVRFEKACVVKSLESLVRKYDLDCSEACLNAIASGDYSNVPQANQILPRYVKAINFVKDAYVNSIDTEFVKQLYAIIAEKYPNFVTYREQDDKSTGSRILIDRVYTSAPSTAIDGMMASLFSFIENSNISALSKAIIAYFYINYIKPFQDYSDEVALLTAKAILAKNNFDEFASILPLEDLLSKDQDAISKIFFEVQKSHDVTYFVNYALTFLNGVCDNIADEIVMAKKEALKEDYYQADETVELVPEEPKVIEPETITKVEEVKLEVEETKPVQQIETPKPVEKEPVAQEKVITEQKPVVAQPQQIAVSYIPPALDEKQAGRLEQHLLELDPELKRKEAHFYARHCTMGKIYTIAQYKKSIGCVYETARTSMDHLAALGYYKKDAFKNKFVYTPIEKK